MPNTTKGTPYVQSSDLVSAYPTTSLSLANHIDNNLAYNAVTFNNQTGTSYTFVLADASTGRVTTASNAAAQTFTVPPQTSVAWATGALIRLVNIGAGAVTIAAGAGVTVSNAASAVNQWESVNILRTGSDTWAVVRGGLPKASYSSTTGSPTVTTVSGKTCVLFTGSGSITVDGTGGTCEVLIVAGGGAGGPGNNVNTGGGGGGGGGVLYNASLFLPGGTLTVTVGAGGAAPSASTSGMNGRASRVGSYYAPGGGGGGYSLGQNGGSGGGSINTANAGGAGESGVGNSGGAGGGTDPQAGGGGGGANAAGSAAASGTAGGNGGAGLTNSIDGTSRVYGSGGGGAGQSTSGTGGTNAGNGGGTGNAGTANFGGGGGGRYSGNPAGAGGSGRVVLLFG